MCATCEAKERYLAALGEMVRKYGSYTSAEGWLEFNLVELKLACLSTGVDVRTLYYEEQGVMAARRAA